MGTEISSTAWKLRKTSPPSLRSYLVKSPIARRPNHSVPQGNRAIDEIWVQRVFSKVLYKVSCSICLLVATSPIQLESDMFWVPVVVSADANAEIGGALVEASVLAPPGNGEDFEVVFAQTVDLGRWTGDAIYHQANLNKMAISVTRQVPFKVDIVSPSTSLPLDGSLDLVVKVTRDQDFEAPSK